MRFFSSFFNKDSCVLAELYDEQGFDCYLRMISSPLFVQDKTYNNNINHFHTVAIEAKYLECNIVDRINLNFENTIQEITANLGKLESLDDLSSFFGKELSIALLESGIISILEERKEFVISKKAVLLYISFQSFKVHLDLLGYIFKENQSIKVEFLKNFSSITQIYRLL